MTAAGAEMGTVVLVGGRVAWAVSPDQGEDLGTYLWRLGKVSRQQLRSVRRRYTELGGRRKVGALFEEEGILGRSILRRCLLLHTRRAIQVALREKQALATWREGRLSADERLTFDYREVMPEWGAMRNESNLTRDWCQGCALLEPFMEIQSCLAAMVLLADGEIINGCAREPSVHPGELAASLATACEGAAQLGGDLGGVSCLALECQQGTVVARWLDNDRSLLAAVVLGDRAATGMARLRLEQLAPTLLTAAAEGRG